jgi:hypothetical protein
MDDPPGEEHFRQVNHQAFMKNILVVLSVLLLAAAGHAAESAVTLTNFKLAGDFSGDGAAFILTATAHVADSRGGSLDLLSGPVALTAF